MGKPVLRSVYYWVAIGDRRSSGCQFQWLSMREAARAIFFWSLATSVGSARAQPRSPGAGYELEPKVRWVHTRTHTHTHTQTIPCSGN